MAHRCGSSGLSIFLGNSYGPQLRSTSTVLLAIVASFSLSAQTYTISTFAGGGLPLNVPGTSANFAAVGPVTSDSAGNLYFCGQNVILRQDAATSLVTLVAGNGTQGYSGDGGPAISAQLNAPSAIATDTAGNVYFADTNNQSIREISKGVITTVAGNGTKGFSGDNGPATSAQLSYPGGVALDAAGNLYITDTANNRIREVSKGVITTVAGNVAGGFSGDGGPAASAELWNPLGIAVDAAGNLYIADYGNLRVRKISNGTITTVAGNGRFGSGGDDGPAISAPVGSPTAVAIDSSGHLYLAAESVREVSNGVITTVAGTTTAGFSGDGGPATSAQLNSVTGVALDAAGNLYVADAGNYRIRKVTNGVISTVAGGGQQVGDNGPGTTAQLNDPISVAADSAGNLYIADTLHQRVRMVSNGTITTVAGNGTPGFSGDGGPATAAQLYSPFGVGVDATGDLYIADIDNNRIRMVSNGIITTVAGNGAAGFSGDNGPAIDAELFIPTAVAEDTAGNLYIADSGNNRIREVSKGIITTAAGNGKCCAPANDGGPATAAEFHNAEFLVTDPAGALYLSDSGSGGSVRKVSNGIITTVAGAGTCCGFGGDNGPAASAQLYAPNGIAVDSSGDLFIADHLRVRRVSNGVITTVAGNGVEGYSGDGGPATGAELFAPQGIAVDPVGNVYLTDTTDNRIRVLNPSGPSCPATAGPTSFSFGPAGGSVSVGIQTGATCLWAIESLPSWITYSGSPVATGPATITLAIAANSGLQRFAAVYVAGIGVSVAQTGSTLPAISVGGIVNGATFGAGQPVAPGSVASAFGLFGTNNPEAATGSTLPTELSDLSLQFTNGIRAPLYFVAPGQVNFQVPWELAGQTQSSLAPVFGGQVGASQPVSLAPFAPGIFIWSVPGIAQQGAILDTLGHLVTATNPTTEGSYVEIYCTGLGPVTNQPESGAPALSSPLSYTTATPTVVIGGVQASVQFSGLSPAYAGLYQVNTLVPAGVTASPTVPVSISIGGVTSNTVTISVGILPY